MGIPKASSCREGWRDFLGFLGNDIADSKAKSLRRQTFITAQALSCLAACRHYAMPVQFYPIILIPNTNSDTERRAFLRSELEPISRFQSNLLEASRRSFELSPGRNEECYVVNPVRTVVVISTLPRLSMCRGRVRVLHSRLGPSIPHTVMTPHLHPSTYHPATFNRRQAGR